MDKELWQAIEGNPTLQKQFYDAVMKSVGEMRYSNQDAYIKAMLMMHESVFGKHFSENLAKHAVAEMENVDGSRGEHWTLAQTNQLLTSQNLKYNKYDFYYLLNMLHSDFSKILGEDSKTYLNMAKAYIDDPDAKDSKVYCIWKSRYM